MDGQARQTTVSDSPYSNLYLIESAPMEVVKASYKALAKIYHPDNQSTGNSDKFKLVTESYKKIQSVRSN